MEAGAGALDGQGAGAVREGPLKRAVSRKMLVFFIVGDMLGGGIYALVGAVGGEVGGAIWTAFLAAFVLAGFTAGAYAELVTKYPRAGGAALYADKAASRSSRSSSASPSCARASPPRARSRMPSAGTI